MDFLTALSTGANSKYATEEYVYSFMQAIAADPHNWLAKVSHNFVGQCFKVLGLKFNASVDSFQQCDYDHSYRDDNLNYVFHVVPFLLNRVETFLDELPTLLAQCEQEVAKDRPKSMQGQQFYDLTNPVHCYLRVVRVWTMVVRAIAAKLQLRFNAIDRYICEPLARLSFRLLHGMVKLLPVYGDRFELLNETCLMLAVLSRYGIFYEATCYLLLTPMLDIFAEHFELFCGESKSALNFIYTVFTCEMPNSDTYIQTYKFLVSMLDRFAVGQQRDSADNLYLRLFTNELITDKYLVIQFDMLKVQNPNLLLMATLQYLQTLQTHLVSAEIFPSRFLQQILLIVLDVQHVSKAVCSMAGQLYVRLAQRQFHEREIFMHILETFFKTQQNTRKSFSHAQLMDLLKLFLKKLMPQFPPLQLFKNYMNVFRAEDVRQELVLMTAQAICALFELYTEQYADSEMAKKQVHKLLACWPDLLETTAQQPEIRAVIFGIYSVVNFCAIVEHKPRLIYALERHSLNRFLGDETLTEAEFSLLFTNICRSVEVTKNEELLVTAALNAQDKYAEIAVYLITSAQEETQAERLKDFSQSVRCLYSLLRQNKLRGHQVCDMYEILATQMLRTSIANERLALYGYECLAFMLALLHRERDQLEDVHEHEAKCAQLADELIVVCVREMCNLLPNLQHAKSLFCAIIVVQLGMQHCLTLNALTYDVLLEHLCDSTLAERVRGNTLALTYLQEMYSYIRQLHACDQITMPTNRIWKPLLQFQMLRTRPDYISPELERLIVVLIKHRFETYAHCLSVIHLHIFNDRANLKRVPLAIAAHMQLLEANASALETWLLRLHVFIASLELLVNRLSVRSTETAAAAAAATTTAKQQNNLVPLRQLFDLVTPLHLKKTHFMFIARLLSSLQANVLNTADAEELDRFLTQISAHKYRCEDEEAQLLNDGEFTNQLKPQPPGPLTMWQVETFSNMYFNEIEESLHELNA